MTTIAVRDGWMASDSCWTNDNEVQEVSATKITRLASGALMGQCGANDSRDIAAMFDKIKSLKAMPLRPVLAAIRVDFTGLLLLPGGRLFKIGTSLKENCKDSEIGVWEINRGFAAAGSGAELAIGAMAAGKSAKEAVRIACKFDINSRLPVHSVAL